MCKTRCIKGYHSRTHQLCEVWIPPFQKIIEIVQYIHVMTIGCPKLRASGFQTFQYPSSLMLVFLKVCGAFHPDKKHKHFLNHLKKGHRQYPSRLRSSQLCRDLYDWCDEFWYELNLKWSFNQLLEKMKIWGYMYRVYGYARKRKL